MSSKKCAKLNLGPLRVSNRNQKSDLRRHYVPSQVAKSILLEKSYFIFTLASMLCIIFSASDSLSPGAFTDPITPLVPSRTFT